jgi:hypothetical protein
MSRYAPNIWANDQIAIADVETIAKLHNGGPNGPKVTQKSDPKAYGKLEAYWGDVEKFLSQAPADANNFLQKSCTDVVVSAPKPSPRPRPSPTRKPARPVTTGSRRSGRH